MLLKQGFNFFLAVLATKFVQKRMGRVCQLLVTLLPAVFQAFLSVSCDSPDHGIGKLVPPSFDEVVVHQLQGVDDFLALILFGLSIEQVNYLLVDPHRMNVKMSINDIVPGNFHTAIPPLSV